MSLKQDLKLFCIIFLAIIAFPAFAADIHDDAGTTGAAFLKIEAGSRPAGMGGAFAGLANDVNTLYWNPAGLTTVGERQFTAMQNFSIADISNQFLGYAQKFSDRGTWGASFLGAFTEIERRRRSTEEPDSTATVGGFAAGLSIAYILSPQLSVGATAKTISQQLDVEDSIGAAADVGMLVRIADKRLGVGIAAQNLGVLDTGENLPMNVRGGFSYRIRTEPNLDSGRQPQDLFALAADVNYPIVAGYPTFHLGMENWFYNMLALRVGYSFSQGENPKNGLTAGFGLRRLGKPLWKTSISNLTMLSFQTKLLAMLTEFLSSYDSEHRSGLLAEQLETCSPKLEHSYEHYLHRNQLFRTKRTDGRV